MKHEITIRQTCNGYLVRAYVCLPDDEYCFSTLEDALTFIAERLDNSQSTKGRIIGCEVVRGPIAEATC